MQRLFAGTAFDRPPTCERCGKLESECNCPPPVVEVPKVAPELQTARIQVVKRPKGKVVTAVTGLDDSGDHLTGLAARLKERCGTGGTAKDGAIELQGDRAEAAERALKALGYGTKRG